MSILDGTVVPIGIPPYLVADTLARGVSATQLLSDDRDSLLSEYRQAHGHIYPWGHITEEPAGASNSGCVMWRLTALEVWYETEAHRRNTVFSVAELNFCLQDSVRGLLRTVLPEGILLADSNWQIRKRHHLFALLAMGDRIRDHRQWFAQEFIPLHLPPVFAHLKTQIIERCLTGQIRALSGAAQRVQRPHFRDRS
jgi:hypothetical protein